MNSNNPSMELDMDLDLEYERFSDQEENPFSRGWMARLPGLLRSFGAAAILFSLYTFFARGWEGSSDLIRYLMLLGHTGALAAIGLASGHFLREGKGARLLVILSMVSVVANFTILGAFILSALQPGQWHGYPHYLTWAVDSPMTAILTTLGSLVVLIPVARVGFLTLARGISNSMTLLFLASNAALLLPVRSTLSATLLTLVMAGMLLIWCGDRLRRSTEVKTREGMIALTLLFLPMGIILGRNVWLYAADSLLYTSAAIAAFAAIRQLTLFLPETNAWRHAGNALSGFLASVTGVGLFTTLLESSFDASLAMVIATLATAAMLYELGNRASEDGGTFRSLATIVLVAGQGYNLLTYGGILVTLPTMATGVVMIVGSYIMQKRNLFIGGAVLLVGSTIQQIVHAFVLFDLTGWATITLVGVTAILVGSMLESSVGWIKTRYGMWKSKYQEWSY